MRCVAVTQTQPDMSFRILPLLLAAGTLSLPGTSSALTAEIPVLVIESTFDSDLEGWSKAPGSDAGSTLVWVSEGGNPGGFLRLNEAAQGATDRISAPPAFLGDRSEFVGGHFSMDRMTNNLSSTIASGDHIRLVSEGLSLRVGLPLPGLNEWVPVTVDLRHDGGWVRVSDSQPPTPEEFAFVLANLSAIHLLADFRSGVETPAFDNIRMVAVPEPATATLLLVLLALATAALRRVFP